MASLLDFADSHILEGFLCPICREDLKSPKRLTYHVEKIHAEEQDVLKSLREIFSKAKKKIKLNLDETLDLARCLDNNLKVIDSSYNVNFNFLCADYQDVGAECSHFSYFNAIRAPRFERYASETNKLIIRLHKLLKRRPNDPVQQKLHDQKIIPWVDGELVNLCPSCAKNFHITRRQHHCRLCGSIMCKSCSKFFSYTDAKNLISSVTDDGENIKTENRNNQESGGIRVCEHCIRLLEIRKEMQDSQKCQPIIVYIYNDIQKLKKEGVSCVEMYIKMLSSLYEGNSIFTISDLSLIKAKIGREAEAIDVKTKEVLALQFPQGSREEILKKAIHFANVKYIKDKMLSLPSLPLEEEIRKIQEQRRKETEQNIESERRLALEAYKKYGLGLGESSTLFHVNQITSGANNSVSTIDNWSGKQNNTNNLNDPLIEQINIIKSYIKQARQEMRFDEVVTLELNLQELQSEFHQRYQQKID